MLQTKSDNLVVTRSIERMLEHIELHSDVPTDFSNAELALSLYISGDFHKRKELRNLFRSYLVANNDAFSRIMHLVNADRDAYAEIVEAFLDDLFGHQIPDDLRSKLQDLLYGARREDLEASFRARIKAARDAGVVGEDLLAREPWDVDGSRRKAANTSARTNLLPMLLAFSFLEWVSVSDVLAREELEVIRGGTVMTQAVENDGNHDGLKQTTGQHNLDPEFDRELDVLASGLGSDNAELRLRSIGRLVLYGKDAARVLPMLRVLLRAENPTYRWEAAWAIGHISRGDTEDIDALIDALDDLNDRVRRMAVLALGIMGPAAKSALPKLREYGTRGAEASKKLSMWSRIFGDQSVDEAAAAAINCISGASPIDCPELRHLVNKNNPVVQYLLEEELERPSNLAPMGVCMCSLA